MGVFQCNREFVRITGVTILATILAMVIAVILTRISAVLLEFDIGWRLHVTAIGVAGICGPIIVIPLLRANSRLAAMKRELEQLARTDALTGLPNRRAFFARAYQIFALLQGHEPAAVLMIDIDRFKSINDTFGHDVGDAVLKTIAQTIAAVVSERGAARALAARIGGEEFAVVVDGFNAAEAGALAEEICMRVREAVTPQGNAPIRATVSVGVALRQGTEPIDEVLKAADTAVYDAKKQGRDRWCMEPATSGVAKDATDSLRYRPRAA